MSTMQLAAIVPLAVLSAEIIRRTILDRIERKGYPLPPGPTSLPFLGSALSINFQEPFRTYTEWQAKYGDIMYVRLLGMDVVVLNTTSVAADLLEKRSQIYSDRPYMATASPYGHDSNFAFSQYGEHLRLCRRILHQTFNAEVVHNFHPMQLRKARQLILSMMDDPRGFTTHYSTFTSSVTMCSIYDYDPKPQGDPMVSTINKFIEASVVALLPERALLLKTFPFLLHIPEWIPGISIKREAREARRLGSEMVEAPYQYVQRRVASEECVNPSMVSEHITLMDKFDESRRSKYEKALKESSTTAFMASVETSSSVLTTFTLAMVMNPHILKRAQADIDAAVGTARLPEFDDRTSLPYIDAILRETMRWQPPVPLGLPHATTKSDIYNGFYIPKGATVFGNVWAMSRDETRYPNPDAFIPDRFLDAEGMLTDDAPDFVFGFGRRICPGRYSAYSSLWISIATMLATLDISLAKDVEGRDVEFEPEYLCGIARHPLTFPCRITPRAHVNRAAIEQALKK